MIKSVGPAISSSVDLAKLRESGKTRAAAPVGAAPLGASEAAGTPAARMAAQGAPVDMDKVAAIKSAIASGNYPVDPQAIAQKMIDLDLPGQE